MNILFLLHSYPKVGGIEMVTQTIAKYLKEKHNLYYLARISYPSVIDDRSNCFYFPSKDKKKSIEYYNRLLAEFNINVVINQGPFLPFNRILSNPDRNEHVRIFSFLHFMPGFEFERIKYVWMAEKKPFKRLFKRIKTKLGLNTLQYNPDKTRKQYRELYNFSEKMIVLTSEYCKIISEAYHFTETNKLVVIPNPSKYTCKESAILNRKEKVVLFVGRLEIESKRVDRLLRVWKSIENKKDWNLNIVGDGPNREELEQLVKDESIENISFLGQQENMEPFYKEASIVALSSTYEGLPLCFIEGIQFGSVPLSFNVSSGIRDILEDISPDILIEPFDMNQYAERLKKLMDDDTYRNGIARKALVKSAEYKLENIGLQWDELLK